MKKIRLRDDSEFIFENNHMEFMGILNITPDSFFEGSRLSSVEDALNKAKLFIEQGATFLDIGGESTRPGSLPVTAEEEINRVVPVVKKIKQVYPDVIISVDTWRSGTAKAALEAGADIINDISGLTFDEEMVNVVKEYNCPIIIMHVNGKPQTMQDNPVYEDVVKEVHEFLDRQINVALSHGISKEKIIIDLGIGFGKTAEHNITLLKNIDKFDDFNLPHLLAVSRKGFIGKTLGETEAKNRLNGTVGINVYAAMKNIEISRVHDIKENLQAVRMAEVLK